MKTNALISRYGTEDYSTQGVGLFDTVGTAFGSAVGGAANVLIAVVVGTVLGYAGARLSVKGKRSRR